MADSALPTAAAVAAYRERGWHVTGRVFPDALLDRMRDLVAEHQVRDAGRRLRAEIGHADWGPEDGPGVRNSEFLTVQEPRFAPVTLSPLLGQIAAVLAGTDRVRLFDDQAVYKPPQDDAGVVGWHSDAAYWSTCSSDRMLTAWIPFEDATVENGAITVVDCSHRWPAASHLRRFNEPDLASLERAIGRNVPTESIRTLTVRKGQVEFHHARLIHASAANCSDAPRLALAVHLQDGANSYRKAFGPDGSPIVLPDDRLARRDRDGNPDYTDPAVFPALWPVSHDE